MEEGRVNFVDLKPGTVLMSQDTNVKPFVFLLVRKVGNATTWLNLLDGTAKHGVTAAYAVIPDTTIILLPGDE